MMSKKSTTCIGNRTGEPLTEYRFRTEAQESAHYAYRAYNNNLIPYKCDKCGLWHLSPKDRQTPSTKCRGCSGTHGKYKDLFQSEAAAKRRAEILFEEKGIRLRVYKCPYYDGWHLTKG
jgi:hypothetical protein